MFTVARFRSAANDVETLQLLGQAANAIRPGTFTRLGRTGCRFMIDVCKEDAWSSHLPMIENFLETFQSVLREARRRDVDLVLDVAIDPSDWAGRNALFAWIPPALSKRLAEFEIEFRFTVYVFEKGMKAGTPRAVETEPQ